MIGFQRFFVSNVIWNKVFRVWTRISKYKFWMISFMNGHHYHNALYQYNNKTSNLRTQMGASGLIPKVHLIKAILKHLFYSKTYHYLNQKYMQTVSINWLIQLYFNKIMSPRWISQNWHIFDSIERLALNFKPTIKCNSTKLFHFFTRISTLYPDIRMVSCLSSI